MLKNKDILLKYLYYVVIIITIIPLCFYSYVFLKYSTNAPYYDDFYWGISFLNDYRSAESISEKIRLIFQQHAQHRIAYFRAFMVGYYHLLGTINFKHLTIIGNFSNLVVFCVLVDVLRKKFDLKYFILPLALIFFQIQYYQNIISTYGFPNNAVIMWVILAFYAATKPQYKWFIFTILAAFLSVFSNGNGILCFPIILFFLFLQKRYLHFKIAALIFSIFIIIYFATFEKMAGEILLSWQTIIYFFKFLSAAFYTGHLKIELVLVVLMVLYFSINFLWGCYQKIFLNNEIENFQLWIFTSATLGWIIATALSVAVYRAIRNASIPNWYLNYSILLIVFSSIFLLLHLKSNYLKVAFFVLITSYGFSNYFKNIKFILPTVQVFQGNLKADIINFRNHKNWSFLLTQVGYPLFKDFQRRSQDFYTNGIYVPEQPNPLLLKLPPENEMKKGIIKRTYSATGESLINFDMLKNASEKNQISNRYGFIKSAETIYYFGVVNQINTSTKDVILNQRLFGEESFFIIPNNFFDLAIPKGTYQIGMVFENKNGTINWYLSDENVDIKNY